MQDTALYEYLLGLKSPWTVSRVELNVKRQCVQVWAEHPEGALWSCPKCAQELPLYDHAEERTWRHLDSCQYETQLHARIPRVACGAHGVVQVKVPWAEARSRFTPLFERLAIDVLGQCDVTGATKILRISWDEAWGIMERAVKRGRQRKAPKVVQRLGIDEKAAAKGHRYLTLVCDLEEGTVEHVAEERKQEHRALMAAGDETLKGSKYLWLYGQENVPQQRRDEFDILRRKELKVGRAWALKESLRRLWHYVYPASGWKFWKRWYFWATHSRLQSMRKAAETIHRHIDNILTYYQHPVTNAMSEGLNSKIQKIKSMACGFRKRRGQVLF